MKRLLSAAAASVFLMGCSSAILGDSKPFEGVVVEVSKVDETSKRIDIFNIEMNPVGKTSTVFGIEGGTLLPSSEGGLNVLIVVSLEEASSTADLAEGDVSIKISQYSDKEFSSLVYPLPGIKDVRETSIEDYIDDFEIGEFNVALGERLTLGSIDGREFNVSVQSR